ncbi:hypothetical protein UFOVP1518_9 [uncultured Caudovirales phage]|uniref:Uncharacterized protein n=1 Tax=uncultured Caudovirales phage TaxID=2100421 RepID=A0A6J5Q888_9CAUD|nr:hypothetical protein UFOVP475_22 [uncultured Caudovirales phage]CAB4169560.1 hypothetical protein UFOVP897_52 [uncultured Caudovirales phage]CAB4175804.1 hypothetical protein UFOVP984_22 [uncultured Caudovirales phage]CAB4181639.1 hypothetical protein UFOVP1072_51 [uncultured Caudovirales phage]CAB4191337.1 hypothetical protein UFOVP1211_21 [uncultured Caudovirales phage]
MNYSISITDQRQADGLEAAKNEYNSKNPQNQMADVSAYLDWMITSAANTAAIQLIDAPQSVVDWLSKNQEKVTVVDKAVSDAVVAASDISVDAKI